VVRANAPGAGLRCGEVLAKVNDLLFESTAAERYATVFYGAYDPASRVLAYANAGHCPPMLLRKGRCIRLESIAPPAGMFAVMPALQDRIELASGDWLLIFSDGIREATNENGDEFGDDGLLNALGRLGDGTAADVCKGVVCEVRNHVREQRQADDITLIAVGVL
jgi:sigma-B regulation protein RsbU (phosphoserine phosphatase)